MANKDVYNTGQLSTRVTRQEQMEICCTEGDAEIAKLDNARPSSTGGHRET